MLPYAKWRCSGIIRSNLSCLPGGAFGLREVKKSLLYFQGLVSVYVQNSGFAVTKSPFSRSQDAEHVEGQGAGWQSVSISQVCYVHFVLFALVVYLFERDTYPKLWRHVTLNKLASY